MIYNFGILDPRPSQLAQAKNQKFLGQQTLGIEVTVPALADQCGLGNIDPQHADRQADLAAIEVARLIPLPEPGSFLVTVRPDCDALGAMAILELRAQGAAFSQDLETRFQLIAQRDKFEKGPWPGPRELPLTLAPPNDYSIMAVACADPSASLEIRLAWMMAWLETGELPDGYREKAEADRQALSLDLQNGKTNFQVLAEGRLVLMTCEKPSLLSLGYCLAPVILATANSGSTNGCCRKVTVAQYHEGYADLSGALEALQALEPGWGGSPTIIASPQGVGSRLDIQRVLDIVMARLK